MKFGKTSAAAFSTLEIGLPPLPYKELKKQLHSEQKKCAVSRFDIQATFLKTLTKMLRWLDMRWAIAANSLLVAARRPMMTSALAPVLAKLGGSRGRRLARWWRSDEALHTRAHKLDVWAQLSREGVRKIVKKYNKQCGAEHGSLPVCPIGGLRFVSSRLRTEIEILARSVRPAEGESRVSEIQMECPVCLDTVFRPVAPACGHLICRDCFIGLAAAADEHSLRCPVCRESAANSRRMHVAGWVAKAVDPIGFSQRRKSELVKKQAELERKYAKRAATHPMLILLGGTSVKYGVEPT